MKTIANWRDLEPYGIKMLTGEACGLQYRILCDTTDEGQTLLRKVFDFKTLGLEDNWNSGSTGSVMLPQEMFTPLAVFALVTVDKLSPVAVLDSGAVFYATPEQWQELHELAGPDRLASLIGGQVKRMVPAFAFNCGPKSADGLRAVHQMSGRSR